MTRNTKNHVTNGIICLMIAYVALLPNFYEIYYQVNRFVLQWSPTSHAAILTAILIVAAICFATYLVGYAIASRVEKLKPFLLAGVSWLLYFVLLRSIINILHASGTFPDSVLDVLGKTWLKLLYYFALPAPFLLLWSQSFRKVSRNFYLLTSPILVMLATAPLYWTSQLPAFKGLDTIDSQAAKTDTPLPNLLVFIFDEWDYEVAFPDHQVLDGMPHLSALLEESTLYTDARSGGAMTATAMTRLLFQRNPDFLKKSYEEIYDDIYKRRDFDGPSIFAGFDNRYTKAMIGFYLNYPDMLGRDVDFSITMPVGGTLPFRESTVELLKTQGAFLRFVGIHLEGKKLRGEEMLFWNMVDPVHKLVMTILDRSTKPIVGIFHYPIPHDPFIYDRNGKKEHIDTTMDLSEALRDRDGYLDNLAYLDTLVGQLVQKLKDRGIYDQTLFVATSDHAWRLNADKGVYINTDEDPKPDSLWKHIPLIIHEPGQTEARRVDETFQMTTFYEYLEGYMNRAYPGGLK